MYVQVIVQKNRHAKDHTEECNYAQTDETLMAVDDDCSNHTEIYRNSSSH